MMSYSLYLVVVLLFVIERSGVTIVDCFSSQQQTYRSKTTTTTSVTTLFSTSSARSPSKVFDPAGDTASNEPEDFQPVNIEDIPENQYNESAIPIANQPWRRGETVGCEDPIDSIWRKEAEKMIQLGVEIVGGQYIDTTWYLTSVVVTIGMNFQENFGMTRDLLRENGPEIHVDTTAAPIYYDPDDPKPEDIDYEEDQNVPIYERDYEGEYSIANKTYAKADTEEGESDLDLGLDSEDDVPLYVDREFREDLALRASELRDLRNTKQDEAVDWDDMFWFDKTGPTHKKYYGEKINTAALSTIAGSVLDALKEREKELQVLSRHEVVLASPSNPMSLDTQKKLDAAIGKRVAVRTHDPWESNRSLYGILVDRNSLDVYINQKGRMVTIPNNFVAGVELMETDHLEDEKDNDDDDEEEELTEEEAQGELMKQRLADFEAELKAVEDEEFDEEDLLENRNKGEDDDNDDDDEDYDEDEDEDDEYDEDEDGEEDNDAIDEE